MTARLRVGINCSVCSVAPGGTAGGVAVVLRSLVAALARLEPSDVDFVLAVGPGNRDAMAKLTDGRFEIAVRPDPRWRKLARRIQSRAARALRHVSSWPPRRPDVAPTWLAPADVAFFDSLRCDVLHFPHQDFTATRAPAIFNPHDLQHLHLPEFFAPAEITRRERLYRAGCEHAAAIAVSSTWIKTDVAAQYDIPAAKIQVIPWGIDVRDGLSAHPEATSTIKSRYALPDIFCLYPANTWPHKNHLRLVEAIALAREKSALICVGSPTDHWMTVEKRIAELGISQRVRFLGFVPQSDLAALFRLASCIVVPTLFEASSALLREGWLWGTPVACSNVTSLPDQAGDAALLFDPSDSSAIAAAIDRLIGDTELRATLVARGRARLRLFSAEKMARAYRALYRRGGGRVLSADEQVLLAADWTQREA